MQPRLRRSRTEVIIAGVCGGLAEYFGIDPVIVRLIFVLLTLTTGIGFVIYPVLWLVMPKAGAPDRDAHFFPQTPEEWRHRMSAMGQEAAQFGQEVREVLRREAAPQAHSRTSAPPPTAEAPPPEAYNFDPLTGEPIRPAPPATGPTVNLNMSPDEAQTSAVAGRQPPASYAPPTARKRWQWIGVVLLGIGVIALTDQLGIDTDIVFPLLMIVAGILLLRRR